GARMTAYRWHVNDPIPFRSSLRFGFEHSGFVLNADGSVKASFDERPDFFSSVAFWFQEGIATGLPVPPYGSRRLPHGNARIVIPANPTAPDLRFDIAKPGTYELLLQHSTPGFTVALDGMALAGIGARDDEPDRTRSVVLTGRD